MATSLMVWLVLLVVAVYDARDNRIPNFLLFPLILLAGVQSFLVDGVSLLLSSMAAGGIFFSCGLVLYFLRAMSPGDVKLLGVVGMLVGWDAMVGAAYWITISAGVVGVLFLLLYYAQHPDSLKKLVGRYSFQAMSGQVPLLSAYQSEVVQGKLTMPFAPAVVIGLALFHYF